jgi:hypothetical protein
LGIHNLPGLKLPAATQQIQVDEDSDEMVNCVNFTGDALKIVLLMRMMSSPMVLSLSASRCDVVM